MRRLTTEQFIEKAKLVHGEKYDYNSLQYLGAHKKVKILCELHGEFYQFANDHLKGQGCFECSKVNRAKSLSKTVRKRRKLSFVQPEDYKLIELYNGLFSKVDNEDYIKFKDINWSIDTNGYAMNRIKGLLHRLIMRTPENMQTDHINHDKLDNRKSNLRIVTISENQWNCLKTIKKTSSIYKGVSWDKRKNKWYSRIKKNNKAISIGNFTSEIEAAKAYDKKAKELFGEFALTNF